MISTSSRRVTIGLPVYNGARYLAETLDSWLEQDYPDFEVIVSDNASTDETPAILADYRRLDSRIRVIRRESTVPAAENFNSLVHEADTPYFAWSAHDDLREPSFLRKLVTVLDQHPDAVLAYPRVQHLKEGEDPAKRRTYYEVDPPGTERSGLWRAIGILRRARSWGVFYGLMRLPAVVRTHLFHTPMGLVADVGFVLELATLAPFVCVPEVLLRLRIHADSMSATGVDSMFDDGRGRRLDAEARAFIETFPLSQSEKTLLLREVAIWCTKGKPRPIWMKIPGARWSYVHGGRRLVDLMGKVRGV
jgi:glycosyltransferase involved in cell wall biosynthesis